jgi:hypothetical protein
MVNHRQQTWSTIVKQTWSTIINTHGHQSSNECSTIIRFYREAHSIGQRSYGLFSILLAHAVMCSTTPRETQEQAVPGMSDGDVPAFTVSCAGIRKSGTITGASAKSVQGGRGRELEFGFVVVRSHLALVLLSSHSHLTLIVFSSHSHLTLISFSSRSHLALILLSSHSCLTLVALSSRSRRTLISLSSHSHLALISLSSYSHLALISLPSRSYRTLVALSSRCLLTFVLLSSHSYLILISLPSHCHLTFISLAPHHGLLLYLVGGGVGNDTK